LRVRVRVAAARRVGEARAAARRGASAKREVVRV